MRYGAANLSPRTVSAEHSARSAGGAVGTFHDLRRHESAALGPCARPDKRSPVGASSPRVLRRLLCREPMVGASEQLELRIMGSSDSDGVWPHRTTIEPSTRQFGLPA